MFFYFLVKVLNSFFCCGLLISFGYFLIDLFMLVCRLIFCLCVLDLMLLLVWISCW